MRSKGYCSWVCLTVSLSVCLLIEISPRERPFVLKRISCTQRATKVKKIVWISLSRSVAEIHRFQRCTAICVVGHFGNCACALLVLIACAFSRIRARVAPRVPHFIIINSFCCCNYGCSGHGFTTECYPIPPSFLQLAGSAPMRGIASPLQSQLTLVTPGSITVPVHRPVAVFSQTLCQLYLSEQHLANACPRRVVALGNARCLMHLGSILVGMFHLTSPVLKPLIGLPCTQARTPVY